MKIITYPNPILRQKSRDLTEEEIKSDKIKQLILDMYDLMVKQEGAGLAAPQIGKNINLFVINANDIKQSTIKALINPKIHWRSLRKTIEEEGCLSLPDSFGQVKRHKKIKIKAINEKGESLDFKAKDLIARIIQHEYDHLNGILFIDRMK